MFQNIQWIFFDVGSTLVDESLAYRHRIEDVIRGTEITYEEFTEVMMSFYRRNLKGDLETMKHFGLTKTPWHTEDERLYPDAANCLAELHTRYKIGVIANQSLGTADRLQAFGVLDYIDLVVASAEEGVAKPNPRIFQIALERAGCRPEQAIMVGDRLDNDIAPANAMGMKTIWIKQGFGQYSTPQTEAEHADWVVENLSEVLALLT